MFNTTNDKLNSNELMDKLSGEYEMHKNEFWDIKKTNLTVNTLTNATIECFKRGRFHSETKYKKIEIKFKCYDRIIFLNKFDKKIQFILDKTKRKLRKENQKVKKLIDLRNKFKD
ncbi:MAG: hypothetical protein ACOCP8_03185 [archaeon]